MVKPEEYEEVVKEKSEDVVEKIVGKDGTAENVVKKILGK